MKYDIIHQDRLTCIACHNCAIEMNASCDFVIKIQLDFWYWSEERINTPDIFEFQLARYKYKAKRICLSNWTRTKGRLATKGNDKGNASWAIKTTPWTLGDIYFYLSCPNCILCTDEFIFDFICCGRPGGCVSYTDTTPEYRNTMYQWNYIG